MSQKIDKEFRKSINLARNLGFATTVISALFWLRLYPIPYAAGLTVLSTVFWAIPIIFFIERRLKRIKDD